ncbi:MAG: hypothetical protein ACK4NP_06305 [Parvularculaceae bacterium]
MSIETRRGDDSLPARRVFGDDVRTAAPGAAPVFGARPPGILVRIAKLFAGRARGERKPFFAAEPPAGVPDPAKIFPAPRYSADGEALSGGQAEQYDLVADELRQEAGELDVAAAEKASALGGSLARSLLDQMEADAVYGLSALLRGLVTLGLVVFLAMLAWRVASRLDPAPFSYATLYSFIGFFGVVLAGLAADGAAGEAKKRFARASADLESLVAQATGRFRDRLIEQRTAMQLNSAADLPRAISAAARARRTTVAGLRFFELSPVIGAKEGYRCHVLGAAIADAARHRLGAGARIIGRFSAMIFGIAIGIAAVFFSLAPPVSFAPVPDFVGTLAAAEAARPGIVTFALAISVTIIAPHILGPMAAQIVAADDPAGALRRYNLVTDANSLKDRALAAAAEGPREMIERFADALRALEGRAEAWAKTGARFGEDAAPDDPPWRKAPEGARFVAQNFASAPPTFVAGAPAAARRGFFSKSARPDAAPKQGFDGAQPPPWLKN